MVSCQTDEVRKAVVREGGSGLDFKRETQELPMAVKSGIRGRGVVLHHVASKIGMKAPLGAADALYNYQ